MQTNFGHDQYAVHSNGGEFVHLKIEWQFRGLSLFVCCFFLFGRRKENCIFWMLVMWKGNVGGGLCLIGKADCGLRQNRGNSGICPTGEVGQSVRAIFCCCFGNCVFHTPQGMIQHFNDIVGLGSTSPDSRRTVNRYQQQIVLSLSLSFCLLGRLVCCCCCCCCCFEFLMNLRRLRNHGSRLAQ